MKCPNCEGRDFAVDATYSATDYVVFNEDGDFDCYDCRIGDGEWCEDATFRCTDCQYEYKESELIPEPWQDVKAGTELLKQARERFKRAGSVKTLERVRLAISSAKGAIRHAELAPYRRERRQTS
jgi:hypothetical protein